MCLCEILLTFRALGNKTVTIFLQMLKHVLQGEAGGTGQIPVCAQEAASQADDSSSDPRAHQTG